MDKPKPWCVSNRGFLLGYFVMIGGADNQDKCLCAQAVYIGACGLQSVKKIEISITLLSSVF